MPRWLFTISALISLLTCLLLVQLWCDRHAGTYSTVVMDRDGVGLTTVQFHSAGLEMQFRNGFTPSTPMQSSAAVPGRQLRFLGLEYQRQVVTRTSERIPHDSFAIQYVVTLPYWLLLVPTLVMPALWLRTWRREQLIKQRLARGECIRCGYDLRASTGRCPECGTEIQTPRTQPPC